MIIGKEVTFELYQFWGIDWHGKYEEEKFQHGIQFDSPKNFFKTLSENHKKKSGAYAIRPYELRRVVKFYNREDWVQIFYKKEIIEKWGDESRVPLHSNFDGLVVDNFKLIGSVVTDRFTFYVRNSLEYAKDIAPFMAKNFSDKPFYCIGKDYDNPDKDKPLLFGVGYYYGPEKYAVDYTYLPDAWDKPVVINSSGYQLWPQIAKKKRPDIFRQILSKKTEDIKIK